MPTSKKCKKCNTTKMLDEFHKCKKAPDGKQEWCKVCRKVSNGLTNQQHNPKNNPNRMYVNGVYMPKSYPLWKPGRYKSEDNNFWDVTEETDKPVHGFVYIIINDAWPAWVKVGMADDAEKRLSSYQTGSPMRDYHLFEFYEVNDRRAAEAAAHKILQGQYKKRGEWFQCSPEAADILIRGTMGEFADG